MATVSGITRNRTSGDPQPNCDVYLFKYASGPDTLTQIDSGVSDGSGNYSLVAADTDPTHFVLGFDESGSPVLAGATVRTLVPIAGVFPDNATGASEYFFFFG